MTLTESLTTLLALSLLGLGLGTVRRILLWRTGKGTSQPISPLALVTIPRRYFVDLHRIVSRDQKAARMHILFAGSMVALVLLLVIVPLVGVPVFLALAVTAALVSLAAGVLMLLVRRAGKPAHLSYGNYRLTAVAALAVIVGSLTVLWSPYIEVGTAIAALGLGWISFSGVLDTPLKHMISGAAHLAFHPRPERFGEQHSDTPSPTALVASRATASLPGVTHISDFNWQQILSFDACIECGRCQQVCPAYDSGQPLNPKKLIQDLHLLSKHADDGGYAGAHHPGKEPHDQPVDGTIEQLIDADTLYSCTSCRACVEECPMMIEHVDAIVDMRRHYATTRGDLPEKSAEALMHLRQTDTVCGQNNATRHQWMSDLALPVAGDGQHFDLLLLCGESVFELRSRSTVRQLISLVQKAGKTIALLADESDCGDLARRLGDEILFQRLAGKMIEKLDQTSFDRIVTLDPHIYHCIKNEYPQLGGNYPIEHASSYLYQLIVEQRALPVDSLNLTLTYHDPCYLGRYNGVIDAPRKLLEYIGVNLEEMERSATRSRCCGWGGGSAFSDIAGTKRIPDMRMDDIRQTGVSTVAVSCPNCMTMLEGVVEPRAEVIDLVNLVARAYSMTQNQG